VIYGALASQVYGTVADQVYQDLANQNSSTVASLEETDPQTGPDPTTLFEAARAKFFQEGQKVVNVYNGLRCVYLVLYIFMYIDIFTYFESKVLAEQQSGRKAAPADSERDRSPIRGSRTPLLPDPVPGSFGQSRSKRRALLPTPPGGVEEPPAAANTPESSDPVTRYTYDNTF